LWVIYVLYFLIGACGFACLFTPMLALTGLWFSRRKGLALGIVTAGGALGQGLVPFVVRLLITAIGWRDAALYLGISYFVVLVPAILLVRAPPVFGRSSQAAQSSNGNLWNLPHTISIPWLATAGIFCCICMAVPLMHLIPLGIDLRFSPQTAAGLLLALMTAGIFGRLFFGWLADRVGGLLAYFCASFVQTAMVFWFTQTANLVALYAVSIIFGFGFAGVMTGLIICAREAAPLRLNGFALAIVTTAAWIGMGIGSYLGGHFHDVTKTYVLSFGSAAMAGVVNLVIVSGLIWYRYRRSSLRGLA
jgi:MFS family permease